MIKSLLIKSLKHGAIGVLPTDTIYGIVGSALRKKTVERIYALRKRNRKKPMIVLIGSVADLKKFRVRLPSALRPLFSKYWPGRVSIALPCRSKKFEYLHCGTKTIAFRLPAPAWLMRLLKKTGPLVAPSANIEGKPPARTIREAKKYFGGGVDFYVDRGRIDSNPSALLKIAADGTIRVLRKGGKASAPRDMLQ